MIDQSLQTGVDLTDCAVCFKFSTGDVKGVSERVSTVLTKAFSFKYIILISCSIAK